MIKAFLSHCSKDKGYVDILAKILGKYEVEYDMMTFEAGGKNLNEIYQALDRSGVFVFFMSRDALRSSWCKLELTKGQELMDNGQLKRFLPIIIDPTLTYDDPEIPDWMRDYNLKYVSKPTYCYRLIRTAIITATWDISPMIKQKDLMFVGRNKQIQEFEERYYEHESPKVICCIVSGLDSIGRRKFLQHVQIKTRIISESYYPHEISLNNRNSIEDLIMFLLGLGYTQKPIAYFTSLSSRSIKEKVSLASELIHELAKCKETLIIEDKNCIVDKRGNLVEWFKDLIIELKNINRMVLCVVSTSRVYYKEILPLGEIFAINMPELEVFERRALFDQLLSIEKLELSEDENNTIAGVFTGYPLQVIQTVKMIKNQHINYVMNHLDEIVDFGRVQIDKIVRNNQENALIRQILIFLSKQDTISISTLCDIFQEESYEIRDCIEQLLNCFLVEFVGGAGDYIRLNDIAKDYVQRLGENLDVKYLTSLRNHALMGAKSYSDLMERDMSDYVLTLKELLKTGNSIPAEFLIPSEYVNAMRELYNFEKKYNQVVSLADRILLNEKSLDKRIVHEIRYWQCLALGRKRDKRLLAEVQKVDGADHFFLIGFYYRMCGRNKDAIANLKKAVDGRSNFYSAYRELVQAYLNDEQYDVAYEIAESIYYQKKDNPYHIQSYIRCLIHVDGAKKETLIRNLLDELKENQQEKADEMYLTSYAQYLSNVKNDIIHALENADIAIHRYPRNIYPYLTRLEVAYKSRRDNYIKESLYITENAFKEDRESEVFQKFPYHACKCMGLIIEGNERKAREYFETKVKGHFSDGIVNDLKRKLNF